MKTVFFQSPSKTAWVLLAAGLLIIVAADLRLPEEHLPQQLELNLARSTADSSVQVYFDTGAGFQETGSVIQPVAAGDRDQHLVFPLPAEKVSALRIDPLTTEGTVIIRAATVTVRPSSADRGEALPLDLRRVTPLHEIAQLTWRPSGGGLEIVTTPGSTDSQCLLALEPPITGGRHTGWGRFLELLPYDVSLIFIYTLMFGVFWIATGKTPAEWWQARAASRPAAPRAGFRPLALAGLALLAFYAWLLLLNTGRSPIVPEQEPSWVAVMTYAIAHHWQFGPEIIMTYGPAMPLTISSYLGSIDTVVFVGRLIVKAWSLVLIIWLGWRLRPDRRAIFYVLAVALPGEFGEQVLWCMTILAAGLLYARGNRSDRWLLGPTMVYVATVALIKVTFLLYAVLTLGVVALDRAVRRQWLAALAPAVCFAACFVAAWCLAGEALGNLPLYLKGSLELVSGYSQAMSLPPPAMILLPGLIAAAVGLLQLVFLSFRDRRPNWAGLPMAGLLAVGLLLAWKQGFVRADFHVIDWFVYAMVAAAAAPAFFPPIASTAGRWLEQTCLALILAAGVSGLEKMDPALGKETVSLFRDRWLSSWEQVIHPRDLAREERQEVLQNRLAYALPKIQGVVGQHSVDVFGDEQAIAILNGLNYRPRPSFLNYSTYTSWLLHFNEAFYCSQRSPEYVLFKLDNLDNRLPTLQSGSLLVLLAEFYQPVLTEKGFVLFQRREQPVASALPVAFPVVAQGDCSLGENLPLPADAPLWCELELRETLVGKLLRNFYQEPVLRVAVTYVGGQVREYRLIPALAAAGFLIQPLPLNEAEYLRWLAGQPVAAVASIRLSENASTASSFESRVHYRFLRAPSPNAATK